TAAPARRSPASTHSSAQQSNARAFVRASRISRRSSSNRRRWRGIICALPWRRCARSAQWCTRASCAPIIRRVGRCASTAPTMPMRYAASISTASCSTNTPTWTRGCGRRSSARPWPIVPAGPYSSARPRAATPSSSCGGARNRTRTSFPSCSHDPAAAVWTAWDLGIRDATAIWFAHVIAREIRITGYYEASGVDLAHYARALAAPPYVYAGHIVPHDAQAKELGTGKNRLEVLASLGLKGLQIAPMHRLEDGINAVRVFLPKCWFDAQKCARGIDALKLYRAEVDERRPDPAGSPR